jgi:DNA repair protein RecN (Recombination protein N)
LAANHVGQIIKFPQAHYATMLTHLAIRDFAVVRAAELEFGPGLTVISGETGAGKSLLVDALGFLSGLRADSGMVRHAAQRAELSARFDLADAPAARAWLAEAEMLNDGLDDGDECQLRRTLRADGGSRAWINGRQATLSQLAELAARLVEIHGQHEHQALLSRQAQLALLDDFGGHGDALAEVRRTAAAWAALQAERQRLLEQGDVSDRIALLDHQLAELARERLEPEAIAELVAAHRRQANAAGLIAACDAAASGLAGDDGPALTDQLHQIRHQLAKAVGDEPRLADVSAMLEAAAIQIDEGMTLLERVRGDLDLDPDRYDELDRGLARLHDLGRKHRVAPDALGERRDAIAAELDALRGAEQRLDGLDAALDTAAGQWRDAAATLTKARRKAAATLSKRTSTLIGELGMGGGVFEAALQPVDGVDPDPQGAERAEFLVSANAGQPPRALRKVASGGELSRISLAIEVAALGHDLVPTMVFDEVDSGIGGATAEIVGQKLRTLGASRQALCVTHLPQVAAQGHAHYRVSKAPVDGMTQSAVELLDDKARTEELARMLGGVEVSKEARAAAKKLLASAATA